MTGRQARVNLQNCLTCLANVKSQTSRSGSLKLAMRFSVRLERVDCLHSNCNYRTRTLRRNAVLAKLRNVVML